MIPYEFTKPVDERRNWDQLPQKEKPVDPIINLHTILRREFAKEAWDLNARELLSRDAKDRLFLTFFREGIAENPTYKRRGWAFSFRPAMNRYAVIGGPTFGHPRIWYAPDKTSVVNATSKELGSAPSEIYEIPNRIFAEYRAFRRGDNATSVISPPPGA